MKKLFSFAALALAFATITATAQPYQRGPLTTNGALQRALSGSAIYVSAAYGSDTNAIPGPFSTLTYAQSVATSGQTIAVLDGTFSETLLGKSNVAWNLGPGVILDGGGSYVWLLTNSAPSLLVTGDGIVTNGLLTVDGVTNGAADIFLRQWRGGGLVKYNSGMSNRVAVTVQADSGRAGSSLAVLDCAAGGTNRINVTVNSPAQWVSTLGIGSSSSNCIIDMRVAQYNAGGNGVFNVSHTVTLTGGRFSRNGTTQNAIGGNVWFKGVSCVSSNVDASAAIFTGVRGTFYFENERTLINNP